MTNSVGRPWVQPPCETPYHVSLPSPRRKNRYIVDRLAPGAPAELVDYAQLKGWRLGVNHLLEPPYRACTGAPLSTQQYIILVSVLFGLAHDTHAPPPPQVHLTKILLEAGLVSIWNAALELPSIPPEKQLIQIHFHIFELHSSHVLGSPIPMYYRLGKQLPPRLLLLLPCLSCLAVYISALVSLPPYYYLGLCSCFAGNAIFVIVENVPPARVMSISYTMAPGGRGVRFAMTALCVPFGVFGFATSR